MSHSLALRRMASIMSRRSGPRRASATIPRIALRRSFENSFILLATTALKGLAAVYFVLFHFDIYPNHQNDHVDGIYTGSKLERHIQLCSFPDFYDNLAEIAHFFEGTVLACMMHPSCQIYELR